MTSNTDDGVTAEIGISSTQGQAPLRISVSGESSTSRNGAITGYAWDFAGQASSNDMSATHLFETPGKYRVSLTVTDETGVSASVAVDVRVTGGEGDEPLAVIDADVLDGNVPLTVHFDGTQSSVPNDTITDYYWDFGDGETSRVPSPTHTFLSSGSFAVELRVVSGGGQEATASTTIVVGSVNASLQFNGSQQARLPVTATPFLSELTVEAWFKADEAGGRILNMGSGLIISVDPATDTITVSIGTTTHEATAPGLSGEWRLIGVGYDAADKAVIYLDGLPLIEAAYGDTVPSATLVVGSTFRGNIAEVRLWSIARDAGDVAASSYGRLTGGESDLLGHWPINEGSGQSLRNTTQLAGSGTLGTSDVADAADPAWSTDGPPF
jgi:PKD repeat protein